jgi:hypothetical protein
MLARAIHMSKWLGLNVLAWAMNHKIRVAAVLGVCAVLFTTASGPAFAELSNDAVLGVIKDAKVWTKSTRITALSNDGQVLVNVYPERTEPERDCKIDAVLATRKILLADNSVARVVVRFYDALDQHKFKQVEVRQSDIAAYGERLIDDDKLLAGISITAGADLPEVVAGPFGEERAAIKQHIGELKNKGVGISAYMRLFSEIEEMAGDAQKLRTAGLADSSVATQTMDKLRASLTNLLQKLDEQERAMTQIKQPSARNSGRTAAGQSASGVSPFATNTPQGYSKVEKLGRFVPVEGPYLLDRLRIGRKLSEVEQSKMPMQHLIDVWRRMDAAANAKSAAETKADVDVLNRELQLPPVTEAERRATTLLKTNR